MALTLHYHPLASFCWKVQVALHESRLPFTPVIVDLGDEASCGAFLRLSPLGKMPALEDGGMVVTETTIILEHLARRHSAAKWLLPQDPDAALKARFLDRVFDLYVQQPMQKIVTDRIRPADGRDPFGVAAARAELKAALDWLEREHVGDRWALGEAFTLADCAAAPALFYADKVAPLAADHPKCLAYLGRLKSRPAFAQVLAEAEPYFVNFPQEP